jgi:hypothetical protein
MPENYDFMPMTGIEEGIKTDGLFVEIEEDSSPQVAILVNLSYAMTCWDGVLGHDTIDRLPPFVWVNKPGVGEHGDDALGDADSNFPSVKGYFEIYDAPAFVFVSADADEPLPSLETYLVTVEHGPEVAEELDFPNANFYTFGFRGNGDFYGAIGLHFGDGVTGLSRFFDTEAVVGDNNNITVYPGAGLWSPDHHPDKTFIRDRKMTFQRTDNLALTFEATIEDGPDCGQDFINWAGKSDALDCMGDTDDPSIIYMRRIPLQ